MKKQRHIIAGILFLLLANLANAQNQASEAVNRIVQSFRNHDNMEMDFTYHYVSEPANVSDEMEGKAYLQGEAYKVLLTDQQTISDGTTIWSYLVNDEEVMVSSATEGSDNTPLKLINTLDRDYTARALNGSTIELTNPNGEFKKVVLTLGSLGALSSMEVHADDGSRMVITFTEIKFDQNLGEGFFTFDQSAHPSVEIIDMR